MELSDDEVEILWYALSKLRDFPDMWPFAKDSTVQRVNDLYRKLREAGHGAE